MTELTTPQNRVDVPTRADAVLEVIHQPLYSAAGFAGPIAPIPFSTELFSYRLGQLVPGAGSGSNVPATLHHTNMTQSGTLAKPKVAEFRQVRQVHCQLRADLSDVLTVTASAANNLAQVFDNLQAYVWATTLRLRVGEKDYLEGVPTWMTPANTGIGGIASVSADDQATAQQQLVAAPNGAGRIFDLEPYAVFLPSQQQFFAQIRCTHSAPPSPPADQLVWVIIDAVIGREVM